MDKTDAQATVVSVAGLESMKQNYRCLEECGTAYLLLVPGNANTRPTRGS